MNYPLISEYIEAIKTSEDNFEELSYLRPVLGDDGLPVITSGNFAVVFKMKDERDGKFYAVKCFTKEQEGRAEAYREIAKELKDVSSPYLVSIRYLEKELFVDTEQTDETEFPVLMMDWVEGKTLDKYLRENLEDKYTLEMLAYRFSQLAQWLIPQPFAHGDLKPDNILVREDGTLVLVDYDGMYVSAMKGQKARELGSPDFRHPLRTESDFDEHIDDFPLVSILFSLKAISISPSYLMEYGAADRLLLSAKDYSEFNKCRFLKEQSPFADATLDRIEALFLLSITNSITSSMILQLLHIIDAQEFQMDVTKDEIADAWKDEKGVRYSCDKRRLLKSPIIEYIKGVYNIHQETKVICNNALCGCWGFEKVILPQGLIKIGEHAFYSCSSLKSIEIPSSVSDIGKWAFYHCGLTSLSIPNSVKNIGEWAFAGCEELKDLNLPNSISRLEKGVFSGCRELEEVVVPNSVEFIGKNAFSYCKRLKTIYLPNRIKEFGENPFVGCESLISIVVPKGTKYWYDHLLPDYKNKLVEKSNVVSITFDSCSTSKVDRCRVFKKNNEWKLEVVYKNGIKTEYPHSLLQGNQSIVFDKQTIEKLQLYVGYCEGLYINPKAVKVDFEYPTKYTAKILFDSDYIEISGITWGLNSNINEWKVKGLRSFNFEERLAVNRAEVVSSDYGSSVCFFMNSGGQTYIPLADNSELFVGDEVDMNTAKLITLFRKGKSDIYRVIE